MLRWSLLALAIAASSAFSAAACAQPATIEPLAIAPGATFSSGHAVSGDGATIVGSSGLVSARMAYRWQGGSAVALGALPGYDDSSFAHGVAFDGSFIVGESQGDRYRRAFRWTDGFLEQLPIGEVVNGDSVAYGVSDDGKVIVGRVPAALAEDHACYWDATGVHTLGTIADIFGDSTAVASSADGKVIVGRSASDSQFIYRAFRWESGVMEDLGSVSGPGGHSRANAVTPDGKVIVGDWGTSGSDYAFRWTRENGMQNLPTVDGSVSPCNASDISNDGRTIVGKSSWDTPRTGGTACIWRDGQPRQLWDLLTNDHGIDLDALGWKSLDRVSACSANGDVLTGAGMRRPAVGQPYVEMPFRVVIPRLNNLPFVKGPVADGGTVFAREGGPLTIPIEGWDPDFGDALTVEAAGLPPGATVTPPVGTEKVGTEEAPFVATFKWTPGSADVGAPRDVTISFRDELNGIASLTFTIETLSNDPPTVAPMTPLTIECIDGQHLVTLETTVDDPDGDPLTVTWTVDGKSVKTENIDAGDQVQYAGDFEHGESSVQAVVSDGILQASATTTVTVEDTKDPTIVVTPQVDLSTDPGKAFATKSRLTPPTAHDASGHTVTFTNDAPATLPLGQRTIVWTATDIGGNAVTASQTVRVVDREKPLLGAVSPIQTFCDPGKTYATLALKKPTATDNVPGTVSVTTAAGSQFKVGTTNVVWIARDAAGNVATKTQTVKVVNRKPRANAGRNVTITTKSEKGARVTLNGSASSDPDKHKLKYRWSAPRVRLSKATTARPSGVFPIGSKTVKLTVTDAAGARHTDTVRVTVKLKNAKRRSSGGAANQSFAAAAQQAHGAIRTSSGASTLTGFAYATAAAGLGEATGEFVRWEEGQSETDALLSYAELRLLQKACGEAATQELIRAYAETGDEALLQAAFAAAEGTAHAGADLSE